MKRLIGLLVLSVSLFAPLVNAQEVTISAEVLYPTVNVRQEPDAQSVLVGQLTQGMVVQAQAYTNLDHSRKHWVLISEPFEGWVRYDLLRFSDNNWRATLPQVIHQEDLAVVSDTPAYQAMVGTVLEGGLNVHLQPDINAPVIGVLPPGSPVTMLGSADTRTWPLWVYVKQSDGNLEGWVQEWLLDFEFWSQEVARLPVLMTLLAQPIDVQGQGIIYVNTPAGLRLRAEPNTEADILAIVAERAFLAVHGRTSHEAEAWVYVTVVETGQSGWVYDPANISPAYLMYPEGLQRENLPVLTLTREPTLRASVSPLDHLPAVTTEVAILRAVPAIVWYYPIIERIPAGTPLTVVGRNINSRWFKVIVNGQEGWIWMGTLHIEGDFNRLPILSWRDGSRFNRNYY